MKTVIADNIAKPNVRDAILRIGSLSTKYNILQEVFDISRFGKVTKFCTDSIIEEFNRCLGDECCDTNEVKDIEWPLGLSHVTFRSNSRILD